MKFDDFFEQVKAMVPWLSPRDASKLLNDFEVELFNKHPEYLELPEYQQNDIVLTAFRKSTHVRLH